MTDNDLGSRDGIDDAPMPSDGEVKHADKVSSLKDELPYDVDKTRSELIRDNSK